MSELDKLKEAINQMRLWLGICVVTNISLIGRSVSNLDRAKTFLLIAAMVVIVSLAVVMLTLNRRIEAAIERLGELENGNSCSFGFSRVYRYAALLRLRYDTIRR